LIEEKKPTNAATTKPKRKHPLQHFLAGGIAGFVESSICHPLDTIKTRMQLRRQHAPISIQALGNSLRNVNPMASRGGPLTTLKPLHRSSLHEPDSANRNLKLASHSTTASAPLQHSIGNTRPHSLGPFGTAMRIIEREGFTALYKGLTAVWTGIVPKMAIRFFSFEVYKDTLMEYNLMQTTSATFVAGLASGITEAVLVVTPAEVCKIRMQSQYHSMMDPRQLQRRKYTNVIQTAGVLIREEGFGALYKGVVPTMMRQGCNQAANFTSYSYFKKKWEDHNGVSALQPWQHLLLGGLSGGVGPGVNNPLDVVKTRMQKQVIEEGKPPKYAGLIQSCTVIAKEEGFGALWKGLTPRLLRIMPGQAITFMTYEASSNLLHRYGIIPVVK